MEGRLLKHEPCRLWRTAPNGTGGRGKAPPDDVPETLCIGKFNAQPLIDNGMVEQQSIVRARTITAHDNMVALRDLLNQLIEGLNSTPDQPSAGSGPLN